MGFTKIKDLAFLILNEVVQMRNDVYRQKATWFKRRATGFDEMRLILTKNDCFVGKNAIIMRARSQTTRAK